MGLHYKGDLYGVDGLRALLAAGVEIHGSIRGFAISEGISYGLVAYVLKRGGDSPTLRKHFKIPLRPRRVRLNIDTSADMIELFDELCNGASRADFLYSLLTSEYMRRIDSSGKTN